MLLKGLTILMGWTNQHISKLMPSLLLINRLLILMESHATKRSTQLFSLAYLSLSSLVSCSEISCMEVFCLLLELSFASRKESQELLVLLSQTLDTCYCWWVSSQHIVELSIMITHRWEHKCLVRVATPLIILKLPRRLSL